MQTLNGLEASFLYLETPEMPMHVGLFNLCELPAGFKGSFHKAVQKHVARRLHLAPVFTRKLLPMPLNLGHPAWIEAEPVDIGFHVRRADPVSQGACCAASADQQHLFTQRWRRGLAGQHPVAEQGEPMH